ncbi:MAG: hypothetical protein NT068_01780 [Candidatus Nomurabacteria bacterium]|nr:hypothetical protein [Candidatus Nomurabacteria bacterium]
MDDDKAKIKEEMEHIQGIYELSLEDSKKYEERNKNLIKDFKKDDNNEKIANIRSKLLI